MSLKSAFDRLPNELYLMIFDFFNSIDLFYSFINLNERLNCLCKSYLQSKWKKINFKHVNRRALQFYILQKQLINQIQSIQLNDEQLLIIPFSFNHQLEHLNLFLHNNFHFNFNDQNLLKKLKSLIVQNQALTWQKPLIQCQFLKEVSIHLQSHSDLIDLLQSLPVVQKLHVKINYEVSNCDKENPCELLSISNKLNDFSYEIDSCHGLVYFVSDFQLIEKLIKSMVNLITLRLYIIGCLNTTMNSSRLERNLLQNLPRLKTFHFFFQTYGGKEVVSMDSFKQFPWHFASYTNQMTDMHFLFTLPFQFPRLDQCLNEYFFNSIRSTFTKTPLNHSLLTMKSVQHLDLSCHITLNLILILQQSFPSLKSLRFSSSTAEYLHPPPLFRQNRYFLPSVITLIFDQTCQNQFSFLCLLPNLTQLILHQSLLNRLLEEISWSYFYGIKQLHLYSFQRHYLEELINAFPNLNHLMLKTTKTDHDGPIRSFLSNTCHHKTRPVSITDILDQLLKGKLSHLKYLEIGCCFERDEIHLQAILSRVIRKHFNENQSFHILTEDFQSTRCGTVRIQFF